MKANALSLLDLFENKQRLEVPLFQRRYVWNQDQQWAPLWEDIERKFTEYLEGRHDAPVHFLGAMVLDQKQTPSSHVVKRQVIDGQQRLTTLQVFLAVFRDFCREQECGELAAECDTFTVNKGMMADPDVERFKVWPTQQDRPEFIDVIVAGSRVALVAKYPLVRRKYSRRYEARPRIIEAYFYFDQCLRDFILGTSDEAPLAADVSVAERLGECFQALKHALQIVAIDLETGDDAQVIFETLNARGEPLLPADLLRNFIFLRVAREGKSQEDLYKKHWAGFETSFWRAVVSQGRLKRPRSDLFMQHFLASQQAVDIPITHLYTEYRYWIEKKRPFASVEEELATLARFGSHFLRIADPKQDDVVYRVATFLDRFDVGTAYPALLWLLDKDINADSWVAISSILESYVLRRQLCGLTTKNYNKVFLTLLRLIKTVEPTPDLVFGYFDILPGESTIWPTDEMLFNAFTARHAYGTTLPHRLAYVLTRIDEAMTDRKAERMTLQEELTIEHVMPQAWVEHWPLSDGSRGLSGVDLFAADEGAPRRLETLRRNTAIQHFGNLTLLSERLNPSISNGSWATKKAEISRISKLAINKPIVALQEWNEEAIESRSRALFELAKNLWPRTRADVLGA
ncbi:MAG TPA: DUF262 domain-containing protein [Gemmatimonadales bacterium]|jgi:hypothetical protein